MVGLGPVFLFGLLLIGSLHFVFRISQFLNCVVFAQLSINFLKFKKRHWWQSCYLWAGYLSIHCPFEIVEFFIVTFYLISGLVQTSSFEVSCACSLDWRAIWFRFAAELSHSAGLPTLLHFRQVSTQLYSWEIVIKLGEWTMNEIGLLLNLWCQYFRRCLPPIRSYVFLPLILLPWIAGAVCKDHFQNRR